MVPRGRLIVFEGAEGVGKTTQLRRLREGCAERGLSVREVREPGGTPVGERIRSLLLDQYEFELTAAEEALLFMASRAGLVAREIRPAVERGELVLADRFFLSTYAYQIAGRGLPEEAVRAANSLATDGLAPDLSILLSLPVDEGLSRATRRGGGGRDRIEAAPDAFHARVSEAFLRFADPEWQAAHPEAGPVAVIDGTGTVEAVHGRVLAALTGRFPETFRGADESHPGVRLQDLSRR